MHRELKFPLLRNVRQHWSQAVPDPAPARLAARPRVTPRELVQCFNAEMIHGVGDKYACRTRDGATRVDPRGRQASSDTPVWLGVVIWDPCHVCHAQAILLSG